MTDDADRRETDRAFAPQAVIRRKRDGASLARDEIDAFVAGVVDGRVAGEQTAAFLMAAFLRGLDRDETVALTRAMTRSGTRLAWAGLDGPVLDKHSTGGIGDNVSLMLAPMVAACGGFVPMISGRGLGHSGGTLDKLESIPGYRVQPSPELFRETVATVGCAIIGQTDALAPADRTLYAIRDVTATVESIPLITASILSKKLAAGLGGLVMDVKTGSGAFMVSLDQSRALAANLRAVAAGAGLLTTTLITDMDQALAGCAGNAIEMRNAIAYLTGTARDPRLHAVVLALGVEMLVLGGLATDRDAARARLEATLSSGAAAERFARMVAALGGPADILENPDRLGPPAPVVRDVHAAERGFIVGVDARAIGLAVVTLGGGRSKPTDRIDPRVGFSQLAPIGAAVQEGPIGRVHAATAADADRAAAALRSATRIGPERPTPRDPVIEIQPAEPV